jgi:hypothetical protein
MVRALPLVGLLILLIFRNGVDDIALAAAACFTAVALLSILYTGVMFIVRVKKIRRRSASSYHDWIGPSVLCGILLLAVVVNFSLRIKAGL